MKICSNSALNKSISAIFQKHWLTLYLCHFLILLILSQTFSPLLCFLLWSLVSDLLCYYCNYLGAPQITHIHVDKPNKWCMCSSCSTNGLCPVLLPLLGPLYSLRHNNIELGQLMTLQWPLSVHMTERVTYLSLQIKS